MQHIVIFEQKQFMMKRIKNLIESNSTTIYEADNYLELEDLLNYRSLEIELIIAELNFENEQEIEMISNYLSTYPECKLIIFTSDMSRKAFLDSIKVGASDYIIHTISDDEIKMRIDQHMHKKNDQMVPTHLILNLNKYISGEMIKAQKGNYQLTIAFSTILNEKGLHISKEDTSKIANYFSSQYWDTDSIVIYGYNHLLSFFPFCEKKMIEILDKKISHMFAAFKSSNLHLAKSEIFNTYVTFPDEGLTVEDILRIVRKKIERSIKHSQ